MILQIIWKIDHLFLLNKIQIYASAIKTVYWSLSLWSQASRFLKKQSYEIQPKIQNTNRCVIGLKKKPVLWIIIKIINLLNILQSIWGELHLKYSFLIQCEIYILHRNGGINTTTFFRSKSIKCPSSMYNLFSITNKSIS